jgi:hypothetical protein
MSILQTNLAGRRVTVNARRESTVVMEGNDTSFTFDYAGRLIGAYLDGRNYRRSLANRVLEKANGDMPGLAARVRRYLTPQEVQLLEIRAYDFARSVSAQLAPDAATADIREAFTRVNHYNYRLLESEREAYERIYKPVTILPPDQYLALYLQATEGCAFNACSFCGFYRDRQFHVKSIEEFRRHILDVRGFFGGGLSLRRSLFLGDANALMIPQRTLVPMFDEVNEQFAILPRGLSEGETREWTDRHPIHFNGVYSFIDAFSTRRRTIKDFQELGERGLRRVYLGLESAEPELLKFLGKPHTAADIETLVNHLKYAGIGVGLIVLVGAGGDRYADAHVSATVSLINALPLDEKDLIYFSELIDYPGSSYSQLAQQAGVRALTLGEIEHQIAEMRAGFHFSDPDRSPKISLYDIREFVY